MRRPSGTRAMPSRRGRGWARRPGPPVEADRPAAHRDQPDDRLQQRRLAGAVGTDDGHGLALVDAEGRAEQGLEVAVAGVDLLDLEATPPSGLRRRRGRRRAPPRTPSPRGDRPRRACGRSPWPASGRRRTAARARCARSRRSTRRPAWIVLDRVDQLAHLGLGEAAGDLVEQQHRGLRRQRPGQLEALAVEQGQRAGADVGLVEHAGLLERGRRPGRWPPAARPACRTWRRRARSRRRSAPRTGAGSAPCDRCRAGPGVGGGRVTSRPPKRTGPPSGERSPAIRLSVVVLPAPFGPTMPSASPSSTENERSSMTGTPKDFCRPSTAIRGTCAPSRRRCRARGGRC